MAGAEFDEVQGVLRLPDNLTAYAAVAIGKRKLRPRHPKRYKS
jgi:hypothetical protein